MELSELHNCKKCRGKIVCIATDHVGNTFCGYCGERVDYKSFFKKKNHVYNNIKTDVNKK